MWHVSVVNKISIIETFAVIKSLSLSLAHFGCQQSICNHVIFTDVYGHNDRNQFRNYKPFSNNALLTDCFILACGSSIKINK